MKVNRRIKGYLKSVCSEAINGYGRVVTSVGAHDEGRAGTSIILAPSWEGSLGDEAVIDALSSQLRARGDRRVALCCFNGYKAWRHLPAITDWILIPDYFKSGGWEERIRLANEFRNYSRFYLVGTDVLDGHYAEWHTLGMLTLARQAARAGLQVTLVGFSINSNPNANCLKALAALPRTVRFCLRDSVSLNRLRPALGRELELTADMAFLLEPTKSSGVAREMISWIGLQREARRLVIGININTHLLGSSVEDNLPRLLTAYKDALVRLAAEEQSVSYLLIPHDLRAPYDDPGVSNELLQSLPPAVRAHAAVTPTPCRASDIKGIVSELDLVLSGRMHVAIACLGSGVPVGCLTYQGKFEGLFSHFGIEGATIAPEEALRPGRLFSFLRRLLGRREELRLQIASRLGEVQKLSAANINPAPTRALKTAAGRAAR